jgi:hypothetical protein
MEEAFGAPMKDYFLQVRIFLELWPSSAFLWAFSSAFLWVFFFLQSSFFFLLALI